MKHPLQVQLLTVAAWYNLLLAAVLIAAVVSLGPTWPNDLFQIMTGGWHGH